ncbi:MAG TPA: bacteriocin [Treponema sp.]|nr:bacteriocin [Treponema sp.]
MSYLSRENVSLPDGLWKQIDSAVVETARRILTGRRFLPVFGPLGIGTESVSVDDAKNIAEVSKDGITVTKGRTYVELPLINADFTLLARDLESSSKSGIPVSMSSVTAAAETCAVNEDRMIYFGNKNFGYEGLLSASGTRKMELKDWKTGENAFSDVAAAIGMLAEKNLYGPYALAVSPDLYVDLQRLQPSTGLLESDRIARLVDRHLYMSPVLGKKKAVLVCSNPANMDLVIGQDMITAYLEQVNLNHNFRVLETILLRIKQKDAVIVFE